MELTDTQLNYFVNNRLKLPKGKRAEYLAQVDHLIERFAAAANGDSLINIKKFLKTGSLRKGTVLRPKGDFGVDADVAVFLNANGAPRYELANLHRPHPKAADEDLSHEETRRFHDSAAHAGHRVPRFRARNGSRAVDRDRRAGRLWLAAVVAGRGAGEDQRDEATGVYPRPEGWICEFHRARPVAQVLAKFPRT